MKWQMARRVAFQELLCSLAPSLTHSPVWSIKTQPQWERNWIHHYSHARRGNKKAAHVAHYNQIQLRGSLPFVQRWQFLRGARGACVIWRYGIPPPLSDYATLRMYDMTNTLLFFLLFHCHAVFVRLQNARDPKIFRSNTVQYPAFTSMVTRSFGNNNNNKMNG